MSNDPLATQTLTGLPLEQIYGTAKLTMPDGTVVDKLVQRAVDPSGKIIWEQVDEKLKAFDERFKDTTTVPNNWKIPSTDTLSPKERETAQTVLEGGMTRIDMRRALVLGLGDPKSIIAAKALDSGRIAHFKKSPSTLTLLVLMAKAHGGEWAEAAKYLKPAYPDTMDSAK